MFQAIGINIIQIAHYAGNAITRVMEVAVALRMSANAAAAGLSGVMRK